MTKYCTSIRVRKVSLSCNDVSLAISPLTQPVPAHPYCAGDLTLVVLAKTENSLYWSTLGNLLQPLTSRRMVHMLSRYDTSFFRATPSLLEY